MQANKSHCHRYPHGAARFTKKEEGKTGRKANNKHGLYYNSELLSFLASGITPQLLYALQTI
jgi:hypothetical protein